MILDNLMDASGKLLRFIDLTRVCFVSHEHASMHGQGQFKVVLLTLKETSAANGGVLIESSAAVQRGLLDIDRMMNPTSCYNDLQQSANLFPSNKIKRMRKLGHFFVHMPLFSPTVYADKACKHYHELFDNKMKNIKLNFRVTCIIN